MIRERKRLIGRVKERFHARVLAVLALIPLNSVWGGQLLLSHPDALIPDPSKPWGEIEAYSMLLEPPDTFVSSFLLPVVPMTWVLPAEYRESDTLQFYMGVGLSESEAMSLMNPQNYYYEPNGTLAIRPPSEVLERLTPAKRGGLYNRLRQYSPNQLRIKILGMPREGFASIAGDSGLSEETVQMVERLCYQRGELLTFSDTFLVWNSLSDEQERWRLLKTLRRTKSWVLNVKIPEAEEELERVTRYFQAAGRNRSFEPLFQSLLESGDKGGVDFVHILPPTPRRLYMTYSNPGMGNGQDFADCYWTAGNFFRNPPSNRFLDANRARERILEEYDIVNEGPMRFGDTIMMFDETTSDAVHAMNYLAEDFVYTKNGMGFSRPFVISKLRDVLYLYQTMPTMRVAVLRPKAR